MSDNPVMNRLFVATRREEQEAGEKMHNQAFHNSYIWRAWVCSETLTYTANLKETSNLGNHSVDGRITLKGFWRTWRSYGSLVDVCEHGFHT